LREVHEISIAQVGKNKTPYIKELRACGPQIYKRKREERGQVKGRRRGYGIVVQLLAS
jgi:hypothetical protein